MPTSTESMGDERGGGNATIKVTDQAGNQVTFITDSTGPTACPWSINGNYTMTETLVNYVTNSFTYTNFNTSTVNNIQLVPVNRTVSMTVTFNGGAPAKPLNGNHDRHR